MSMLDESLASYDPEVVGLRDLRPHLCGEGPDSPHMRCLRTVRTAIVDERTMPQAG